MRKVASFLLCWLVLSSFFGFSQGEKNNWLFGDLAGIQFANNQYVGTLPQSAMQAVEGCASMSDADGNLLFYTNGNTVWNAQNEVIENGDGLIADLAATNSAMILKAPGDNETYYVFTSLVDCVKRPGFGQKGMQYYSLVDMNANNGLGRVTEKNSSLISGAAEKISALPHANGEDIWLITYRPVTLSFNVRLISEQGIGSATNYSLSQQISPVCPFDNSGSVGYMKGSPDGTMFANVDYSTGNLSLFRFDSSSGVLSNEIIVPIDEEAYGVEFSPNSRVLYISFAKTDGSRINSHLKQYSLFPYNRQSILDSETEFVNGVSSNPSPFGAFGALQLAPDGKIYVATLENSPFEDALSVINDPNTLGSPNFSLNEIVLTGGTNSTFGLPMFMYRFNEMDFFWSTACSQDEVEFTLIGGQGDDVTWNFGDMNSSTNTSTDLEPRHQFSSAGSYTVTAIVLDNFGETHNLENTVFIQNYPTPNTGVVYEVDSFFPAAIIDHNTLSDLILNDQANESITYFLSFQDATNEQNEQSDPVSFQTGEYFARVENLYSECVVIVPFQVEVTILDEDEVRDNCRPIFPTAITPDSNGINDLFTFFHTDDHDCEIIVNEFTLFDRWGNVVAKNASGMLNMGTSNDVQLSPGIYLYEVNYSLTTDYVDVYDRSQAGVVNVLQ